MRALLFFILFTLGSCQNLVQRIPADDNKIIDIVFDLDWTLISKVDGGYRGKENVIRIGDEWYRIHDWARELITLLNENPRYRVSFFSGGPEKRNLAVLEKIKILDGTNRSLLDIAHKTLHRTDLLNVTPPASLKDPATADYWKKDLTKINSDLKRVVMFEDDARHALKQKQRGNFLWMGMSYYHFESNSDYLRAKRLEPNNKFIPPSSEHWALQRNKLAVSYGLLEDSIKESDENGGNLHAVLQRNIKKSGIEENILSLKGKEYFYRGSHSLKKINARGYRQAINFSCVDSVGPFFRPQDL